MATEEDVEALAIPVEDEDVEALAVPVEEAPVAAAPPPPPAPAKEPSFLDHLRSRVKAIKENPRKELLGTADRAATNALQGWTMGGAGAVVPYLNAAFDELNPLAESKDFADRVKYHREGWNAKLDPALTGAAAVVPSMAMGPLSLGKDAALNALLAASEADRRGEDLTNPDTAVQVGRDVALMTTAPKVIANQGAKAGARATSFVDWLNSKAGSTAAKARDVRDWGFFKTLDTRKADFKAMDHLDNEGDLPQFAYDRGLMTPTSTARSLSEAGGDLRMSRGADVGEVLDTADVAARSDQLPNVGKTLERLRALRDQYSKQSATQRMLPQIDKEIADIEAAMVARAEGNLPADPRMSFRDHEAGKTLYDDFIDHGADKASQRALKEARKATKEVTEDALRGVDPKLAEDFAAAKSDVGNAAAIEDLGKKATFAEKANRKFSPSDYLAAATAGTGGLASTGDPYKAALMAAVAGTANHLGKTYAPAALSVGANKVLTGAQRLQELIGSGAPVGAAVARGLPETATPAVRGLSPEFLEWLRSQGGER